MIYEKRADDGWYLNFDKYHTGHVPTYNPLPHFHSSIEIYVVEHGSYPVNINGQRREISVGDIAFVDRFTPHTSGRTETDARVTCDLRGISYRFYVAELRDTTRFYRQAREV